MASVIHDSFTPEHPGLSKKPADNEVKREEKILSILKSCPNADRINKMNKMESAYTTVAEYRKKLSCLGRL